MRSTRQPLTRCIICTFTLTPFAGLERVLGLDGSKLSGMNSFNISGFVALAAGSDSGGSPWLQLVPFVLVLGIFYFIILLPMRKKQQKVQTFLEGLKVGDKVVTTGGIYGQVTRISGDTVQLQIADKVRIDVSKAAVGGLQGQPQVQDPSGSVEAKS